MTAPKLSVNINKFATIRNARGGNNPNLIQVAKDCESFGAHGITVHPRPDQRHIRYSDAHELRTVVKTEYNIEGNPNSVFIDLVLEIKPTQVTLVPDSPDELTSNAGWDCIKHSVFLQKTIEHFHNAGIRTSIFIDPIVDQIKAAKQTGTDRVELYTEGYARTFHSNKELAIEPYKMASNEALRQEIGLNAGHDLDLQNLQYFRAEIPNLLEVSIGHALVCDALYLGLNKTIKEYLKLLK
ncbi:MAG: pyridoxine 5-phosphate synthase [Bacteroidia bacterium]|jgi:pyridoxine 5-phosphate synthase